MHPYQPQPPRDDGGATASLILGILGLVLCGLLAPVALFMGLSARRRIRASGGYLTGDSQATAGIVMGAIGTAIIALAVVAGLIAIIVVAGTSGSGG